MTYNYLDITSQLMDKYIIYKNLSNNVKGNIEKINYIENT